MVKSRRAKGSGAIHSLDGNTHKLTVELARDPVTGRRKKRRWTVCGTKREAQRALREAQLEVDHGVSVDPSKLTMAEYLQKWLPDYRARRPPRVGDSTYMRYSEMVHGCFIPRLGHIRVQALTPEEVRAALQPDERRGTNTMQKHYRLLKRALTDAVQSGIIYRNPIDQVEPLQAEQRQEERALDDTEVEKLLTVVRDSMIEMPVVLALDTGARQGELLGLKWADIDWDAKILTIRRSARRVKGMGIVESPTKNKRTRYIEFTERTLAQLQKHRARQAEHRLRVGPAWQDCDLVFPSAAGTFWDSRNLYRHYRAAVDASGIQDPKSVKFHNLRHTAANLWIADGAEMLTVSRRMGHATSSFTMDIYGHLRPGQQRVAAQALDRFFT